MAIRSPFLRSQPTGIGLGRTVLVFGGLLLTCVLSFAARDNARKHLDGPEPQVAGQQAPLPMPPAGYPPGTYPPGQHPRERYPGGRIPTPVPGVEIPTPEIKIPRRGKRTEAPETTPLEMKSEPEWLQNVELGSFRGNLREMGDRHLVLETAKDGLLGFRLLTKTRFVDSESQPIRDSLLRPGDHLQLEVNVDDQETILRVTLLRVGSEAERELAARSFDRGRVGIPGEASKAAVLPKPDTDNLTTASRETGSGERPAVRRGQPEEYKNPIPEPLISEAEALDRLGQPVGDLLSVHTADAHPLIREAREEARRYAETLPDFLVRQFTTRYASNSKPPDWRALDVVTAELAVEDGKEDYRNFTVNGRKTDTPPTDSGAWSSGEFITTALEVLSAHVGARFKSRGDDTLSGRNTAVFNFEADQPRSQWTLIAEEQKYRPAYRGAIWIDKASKRVMRIERQAVAIPADFPYDKAEMLLQYDFVRINNRLFLLPVHSENLTCMRDTVNCTRNIIDYRNYQKFEAATEVRYSDDASGQP